MERPPTPRQRMTLAAFLATGSRAAAAHELGIDEVAASSRIAQLYEKLGASGVLEAAAAIAPEQYRELVRAVAGRQT